MITVPIASISPYQVDVSPSMSRTSSNSVLEIFTAMRDSKEGANSRTSSNASNLSVSSLASDNSLGTTQFFEVMYVGKIKVSHKKAPPTFIDDALEKFRMHETERLRQRQQVQRQESGPELGQEKNPSGMSIQSLPSNSDHPPVVNDGDISIRRLSVESTSSDIGSVENLDSRRNSTDYLLKMDSSSSNSDLTIMTVGNRKSEEALFRQPPIPPDTVLLKPEERSFRTRAASGDTLMVKNRPLIGVEPMRARASSFGSEKRPKRLTENHKQDSVEIYKRSDTQATTEHNRTMLFQIGRIDLRLISPDRKSILLHKNFKDISHCSQGIKQNDHFGFICRDSNCDSYVGYVFRCESESVVDDILSALKQAFHAAHEDQKKAKVPVTSCDHCPMTWFHKLCTEVDAVSSNKVHSVILRKIETLPEDEQEELMAKFQGAETNNTQEENEIYMMLLRAHCENKQSRHIHDTAENRSEFLNAYLGGGSGALFMRAKRSLSNSFDNILKRKPKEESPLVREFSMPLKDASAHIMDRELSLPINARLFSKDNISHTNHVVPREAGSKPELIGSSDKQDLILSSIEHTPDISPAVTPTKKNFNCDFPNGISDSPLGRPRSSTVGSAGGEVMKKEIKRKNSSDTTAVQKKSPMVDIYLKVGGQPRAPCAVESPLDSPRKSGSWRQAIFHTVITPTSSRSEQQKQCEGVIGVRQRSKQEYKALWQKAIMQQILLIRMEKENKKLKARQEEAHEKRIKLDYEELVQCETEVVQVWDLMLQQEERDETRFDPQVLSDAVKQGVPRARRGEIWHLMAEQYILTHPPPNVSNFENYHVPYDDLLHQLTSHHHQHAILIDLGRTFPNLPYYMAALGPGQLALFNLLKAYSLLDTEVGYCQGLSFVVGVLLLHMSEDVAFSMLKHLMFTLGIRRQYKPDMVATQIQMYQLTRLIHDTHRDLYEHFEKHEIAPTLYAAPWFLTLFASQFPLGFVCRVFDLIFLYGMEAIFKVALVLLGGNKPELLKCDTFEDTMEYLKTSLPFRDGEWMEQILTQVYSFDISKQLHSYEVEYHVLQEEMLATPRGDKDALQKLETANRNLKHQNMDLLEKLQEAHANINSLETHIHAYQRTIYKLESRAKVLEVERSNMIKLIEEIRLKCDVEVEIPVELKKYFPAHTNHPQRKVTLDIDYDMNLNYDSHNLTSSRTSPHKSLSISRESSLEDNIPIKGVHFDLEDSDSDITNYSQSLNNNRSLRERHPSIDSNSSVRSISPILEQCGEKC